jgi:hypothetical protein
VSDPWNWLCFGIVGLVILGGALELLGDFIKDIRRRP